MENVARELRRERASIKIIKYRIFLLIKCPNLFIQKITDIVLVAVVGYNFVECMASQYFFRANWHVAEQPIIFNTSLSLNDKLTILMLTLLPNSARRFQQTNEGFRYLHSKAFLLCSLPSTATTTFFRSAMFACEPVQYGGYS